MPATRLSSGFRADVGAEERGQAEVDEPHTAESVDQDVFRLDVAVDDAGFMCVLQRLGDLRHEFERVALGDRPIDQQLPQAGAFHEFHDDVVKLVGLADVEHRDDVGMSQLGQRPRLADEPLLKLAVGLVVGPEDLDGHVPVEQRLTAFVDGTHPALARATR